jgi:hypothetical protein
LPAAFTGIYISNAVWGDYNGDGNLDVLITGYGASSVRIAKIYRNDGGGIFTDIAAPLPLVGASTAEWGDYDRDGDLDLVIAGNRNSPADFVTQIFRNEGSDTFVLSGATLTGVATPSLAWGDCDNDGDLDLAIAGGIDATNATCLLYRNDGNSLFTLTSAVFDAIGDQPSLAWGDYNNDGLMDLLAAGRVGSGNYVTNLYQNNGNFAFSTVAYPFVGLRRASVAWGDYDNDRDLDMILTGSDNSDLVRTVLYRNDGGGTFSNATPAAPSTIITPICYGKVLWGDYNSDGNTDILEIGQTNTSGSALICKIFQNNGDGTWTDVPSTGLPALRRGSAAWGDYNNDGKPDLLLTGRDASSVYYTKIYASAVTSINTDPTPPASLISNVAGNTVTLKWNKGNDTQTPANGLTYNLTLGTTIGGGDIVNPSSNALTGIRRIPAMGNMQCDTSFIINLPNGTYYWNIQSIDNGFEGSAFAQKETIIIGATDKTLNLTFFIEGLFNGAGLNKAQNASGDQFTGTIADTTTIEIHSSDPPYALVYNINNVSLNTDGTCSMTIPASYNNSYYIAVKHRNTIQTWSSNAIAFTGTTISYNFTDSDSKAFGNNQKLLSGYYCFYAGDANIDGSVDGLDMIDVDNQSTAFASGYLAEDINGDGSVDALDMILLDNNATMFVSSILP